MAIKKSDPPSKKKLSQMEKLEAAMVNSGFYNPKAPPKYGAKITSTTGTISSTAKKKAALKSMTSAQSEGISEAAQQKVSMALKKKPVSKK
jgi:hypothetical protein